jgi:hypothetical protein
MKNAQFQLEKKCYDNFCSEIPVFGVKITFLKLKKQRTSRLLFPYVQLIVLKFYLGKTLLS